jgi:hypothetical protein
VTSEGVVLGDAGGELDPLVTAVAQDRRAGVLTRELTPEVLAELVERIGVDVVDPGHLARADDFFAARDHRRAEDPHPRSSFTIDL